MLESSKEKKLTLFERSNLLYSFDNIPEQILFCITEAGLPKSIPIFRRTLKK